MKGLIEGKRGQQEMIGFVLIIVLVVVAVLVLLMVSLKKPIDPLDSVEIENLLSSITRYTTECADYEPNYYDVRDLIRACVKGNQCENLGQDSCIYLETTLKEIVESSVKTESTLSYYKLDISPVNEERIFGESIISFSDGNCTGNPFSGQQKIKIGFEDISLRMKFCKA
jgi:hypothetical protein